MKKIIINQKNLLHNLEVLKNQGKAKIIAVVKANAYGHGSQEICTLLKGKVEFFAVANIEEAIQIREFDKTSKLLIMGKCSNLLIAIKNSISVTAFSVEELLNIKLESDRLKENCNVHVKINSGMNRIGIVNLNQFKKFLKIFQSSKYLTFEGIFTHFSTLRNDIDYYENQQNKFLKFLKIIPKKFSPIIHGGGSLAIFHEHNYDMLRCGILLYGIGSPLFKQVIKIEDNIIQVLNVKKGAYIGYSKDYIAEKDMKIGIIPTGYDDGIPRNSIGQFVKIRKTKCKILSVCMDMTIIEVPKNTKVDDTVTLLHNVEEWAKAQKTNNHEILVRFNSFRGKRIVK